MHQVLHDWKIKIIIGVTGCPRNFAFFISSLFFCASTAGALQNKNITDFYAQILPNNLGQKFACAIINIWDFLHAVTYFSFSLYFVSKYIQPYYVPNCVFVIASRVSIFSHHFLSHSRPLIALRTQACSSESNNITAVKLYW